MSENETKSNSKIRTAVKEDVPLILEFVKSISTFEKLSHLVTATEETLAEFLFGKRSYAEVFFAELDGFPAGFTVFFTISRLLLGNLGFILRTLL